MGKKDARVDAYIASAPEFSRPILKQLRKAVHAGCPTVEETLKWNMPFFMYQGLLCHMAAFTQHCAFGFWKGQLIFGKNSKPEGMGHLGKLSSLSDLPPEKELVGHIKKAVALNDAGVKSPTRSGPRKRKELVVPDYFLAALRKNKKALATFDGFSYSHKKEYVEWITEAKQEATRERRLGDAIDWMSEGKSRHWKYENC